MQKLNLEKPFQKMLDAVASYSLDLIQIHFDGVDTDVRFVRKGVEFENLGLKSQHRKIFRTPKFRDYFYEDHLTLRSLVEAVANNFMAQHFPGRDLDEGTYGTIEINFGNGSVSVDFNLSIVDNYVLGISQG